MVLGKILFEAFAITVVVEIIVALFFGFRKKSEFLAIILINLITNPLLNYLLFLNYTFAVVERTASVVLVLELIVVLIEWWLLKFALRRGSKEMFVLSFVMNSCSFMTGVLVFGFD